MIAFGVPISHCLVGSGREIRELPQFVAFEARQNPQFTEFTA
jgi:hypothetical protein